LSYVSNNKQVVKAIWQKRCIAAAHGRFNGIFHWCTICASVCFLGPISVHNLNGISIDSLDSAQLTAQCHCACLGKRHGYTGCHHCGVLSTDSAVSQSHYILWRLTHRSVEATAFWKCNTAQKKIV